MCFISKFRNSETALRVCLRGDLFLRCCRRFGDFIVDIGDDDVDDNILDDDDVDDGDDDI
ncbi:hypothetical protein DERF_008096 [Dermatophagoides farinae]|uniref:Uncharacterized protein n=1 Tax=Dermatophagoides farinae TaxID=6954 RepID=A0A922L553_DERFA|nr:hypothetical protein DERF_008096 [Dermatophagoides farinae]